MDFFDGGGLRFCDFVDLRSMMTYESMGSFSSPTLSLVREACARSFPRIRHHSFSLIHGLIESRSQFVICTLSGRSQCINFVAN